MAFNDLEGVDPDIVISLMAGARWEFDGQDAVVVGAGQRLYLPSSRVTVPVLVSFVKEF